MSVITNIEIASLNDVAARRSTVLPALVSMLAAAATAAFLWAFALPMVGLAVFVSKFFAG